MESHAQVRLEVVPSDGLTARLPLAYQAPGALSVTCLPHHGPARTTAAAVELARLGYHVVPHLAARSISSRTELHTHLEQLQAAGVSELFLVAGDSRSPAGPYSWSGHLMEDVKSFPHSFSVGIAGYPEGHPQLTPQQLGTSLDSKAALASSLVTQMCFSADAIVRYFEALRHSGAGLPVWVGVPGPITTKKLLAMGARLGVGRSLKLARGTGMAKALLRRGDVPDFDSTALIQEVHQKLGHEPMFAGFHIYTFNDLERLPGFLRGLPAPPAARAVSPVCPAKI
jgi:methylenetetrahydrofolate reductase (NADPH)